MLFSYLYNPAQLFLKKTLAIRAEQNEFMEDDIIEKNELPDKEKKDFLNSFLFNTLSPEEFIQIQKFKGNISSFALNKKTETNLFDCISTLKK